MMYFIILHYMVEEETKKCVDSILQLNGEKRIVVVDNCSPNDSYIKLQDFYKKQDNVSVIQTKENIGYANGNNFGYNYIMNNYKNIDFIVAMNNDMEIMQKDFIKKVYDIYENKKFFVLAPDVYSTSKKIHQNPETRTIRSIEKIDEELKKMEAISINKLKIKGVLKKIPLLESIVKYLKNKKRRESKEYLSEQYNKTLHGSCLIFSKKFIKERSYIFFPKTKFYCEAQILDYECEKNNWLRVYSPEIQVLHHEDVATNASYTSYVKKSLFMNNCMCESLKAFRELIKKDEEERGR